MKFRQNRKVMGKSAQAKNDADRRKPVSFPREMMGTQLDPSQAPQPGDPSTKLFANTDYGKTDDWDRNI